MKKLKCNLICYSDASHVQQLYTGFKILAKNNIINIKQEIKEKNNLFYDVQHLKDSINTHLKVKVYTLDNKETNIYFDNHDAKEISNNVLERVDIYFKRSYSHDYILKNHQKYMHKIYPLGLYNYVLPNDMDLSMLYRSIKLDKNYKTSILKTCQAIDAYNILRFYPRVRYLHEPPKHYKDVKVLFMVAAHDPYDNPERTDEKIKERSLINDFRAECIRILRKELGDKFHGGFIPNKYASDNYPELLVENSKQTRKKNYIQVLNEFPIGVATTGLHGSIGGKLTEYVAHSKAIVSEKLEYQVPGPFQRENNYLEFSTPEECVIKAKELIDNTNLRNGMMHNNFFYYHHYVRPDMLVLNALVKALELNHKDYESQ